MRSSFKFILLFLCCLVARLAHGQEVDSVKTLDTVIVLSEKNVYINIAPVQQLDR